MPKINIKILITEIFPQKNVKKEFLRLMQFPHMYYHTILTLSNIGGRQRMNGKFMNL